MCDAEDELRRAERTIVWLEERCDMIVDLAADTDRGIIDLTEFRREAERLRVRKGVYA